MNSLKIKNMVCNRCIEAVEEEFKKLAIPISSIQLGEVKTPKELSIPIRDQLASNLKSRGFELLKNRNQQIIERIKNLVITSIQEGLTPDTNYSTFLEKEIGKDYSSLSSLFSSVEGITIERFIILQKLEKVKELIIYDELSLSEIAYKVGYSSVQHLSNQFKKNIGLTPSEFKKSGLESRSPLDEI